MALISVPAVVGKSKRRCYSGGAASLLRINESFLALGDFAFYLFWCMEIATLCQNEITIGPLRTSENKTEIANELSTNATTNLKESEKETPIIASGKIYLITNLANSKKYVGVTTKTLNRRFGQHLRQSEKPVKLAIHQAIKKYGKQNFRIDLIEELQSITEHELLLKESYYISKYNTWVDNGCGYNMEKYGGGRFIFPSPENPSVFRPWDEWRHNIIRFLVDFQQK